MMAKFNSVPDSGKEIEYLGKKFIVYKNVFWPFEDSKPLVENYKINKDEDVLDIGTGSGVIAIFSAYKGAKKVVALDIDPMAVKNARGNVKLHGLSDVIDIRVSDTFNALGRREKFNVITANLPFAEETAAKTPGLSIWDPGIKVHKKFFDGVEKHLKPNGRIYLAQSNFGAVDEVEKLAKASHFNVNKIGQKAMSDADSTDPRVFFAFELTKS